MANQGFSIPPYFQQNSVGSQYSLNGELPPEIAVKEQALNRKQQIANLMLQNSMRPIQGMQAGRFFVPPSWAQGAAQIAEALGGGYINNQVDKGRAGLADENQKYIADAVSQYQKKMAGTPEQPGQPMEMPAQGPGRPEMVNALASRNGAGDPGMSGKLPDMSAPVAIEGPQPTATVPGPATPAQPATPEQKQAAMMELLAKRIPGAQTILAMQQHQEQLDAANQDRKDNRAFLATQKDEDRQVRRDANEQNAALRVEQMKTNTNMLQMQIEERQARGQDTRDLQKTLADQQAELKREQMKAQDAMAKRHEEMMMSIAKMGNQTKENVAATKGQGKGMSATAQKELIQTEEELQGSHQAIKSLNQALSINDKAMGFTGAGALASAGSLLPEAIRPGAVDATVDLDNILTGSALPQLKAIFGGMPTEGERKVLLDVQGSSGKTPAQRKEIIGRAIQAAEARIKFGNQKAKQLRDGTYFTGEGGLDTTVGTQQAAPSAAAPMTATGPNGEKLILKEGQWVKQ